MTGLLATFLTAGAAFLAGFATDFFAGFEAAGFLAAGFAATFAVELLFLAVALLFAAGFLAVELALVIELDAPSSRSPTTRARVKPGGLGTGRDVVIVPRGRQGVSRARPSPTETGRVAS